MLGRQAKIVSPATLRRILAYARQARQPKRDTVIVLLSVKAGLRACEIVGLQGSMVITDNGKIGDVIDIRDTIAKRGSGRRIPMHPGLQRALAALWRVRTSDRYSAARCAPTASSTGSSPCSPNVSLRPPDLHHYRRQECVSRRRQPAGRSVARWPSIDSLL
jgi:integrase